MVIMMRGSDTLACDARHDGAIANVLLDIRVVSTEQCRLIDRLEASGIVCRELRTSVGEAHELPVYKARLFVLLLPRIFTVFLPLNAFRCNF